MCVCVYLNIRLLLIYLPVIHFVFLVFVDLNKILSKWLSHILY
jgi:hypothetical protein